MSEEFKINKFRLNEIINQYNQEQKAENTKEKENIPKKYFELVLNELGTDVLKEAISFDAQNCIVKNILERKRINEFYTNEESLRMLEGISNYNIVGDWQCFFTVTSQYIFKLPAEKQRMFAENFAIGNNDAKECLLKLWQNHIETTGTDIARKGRPGSTNAVTMKCNISDLHVMMETLRKGFNC